MASNSAAPVASPRSGFADPIVAKDEQLVGIPFLEAVSSDALATDRLPLIIGLHAQGESPPQFLTLFRGLRAHARIVLPYADPAHGPHSWYVGASTDPGPTGPQQAGRRVLSLLGPLLRARPTMGKPILIGYSQGAIVAMTLAALHGSAFASVLPIAGRLPPALLARIEPARGPEFMLEAFHGENDQEVPYSACRASLEAFQAKDFATRLHTYEGVGHEISEEEARDILSALERAADPPGTAPTGAQ